MKSDPSNCHPTKEAPGKLIANDTSIFLGPAGDAVFYGKLCTKDGKCSPELQIDYTQGESKDKLLTEMQKELEGIDAELSIACDGVGASVDAAKKTYSKKDDFLTSMDNLETLGANGVCNLARSGALEAAPEIAKQSGKGSSVDVPLIVLISSIPIAMAATYFVANKHLTIPMPGPHDTDSTNMGETYQISKKIARTSPIADDDEIDLKALEEPTLTLTPQKQKTASNKILLKKISESFGKLNKIIKDFSLTVKGKAHTTFGLAYGNTPARNLTAKFKATALAFGVGAVLAITTGIYYGVSSLTDSSDPDDKIKVKTMKALAEQSDEIQLLLTLRKITLAKMYYQIES